MVIIVIAARPAGMSENSSSGGQNRRRGDETSGFRVCVEGVFLKQARLVGGKGVRSSRCASGYRTFADCGRAPLARPRPPEIRDRRHPGGCIGKRALTGLFEGVAIALDSAARDERIAGVAAVAPCVELKRAWS